MIRDFSKLFKIILISLVSIYLLFPLVHECGHGFFCLLVGSQIKSFQIFPTPCVLCSVLGLNTFEILFIGSGGAVMTFLFSVIFNFRKNFYLWFAGFFFRLITAISLLISCLSSVMWGFGISVEGEDAAVMLHYSKDALYPIILGSAGLLFFTLIMIKRDNFIRRIGEFFHVEIIKDKQEESFAKENEGHKI